MIVSSRALVAVGLGLVGMGILVGPSLGQDRDGAVRKTNGRTATPTPPAPAIFGSIDMEAIFKGYDKFKALTEEFEASVKAKQGEMMKIMQEMQHEGEVLSKLTPGSVDFKKHEGRVTELKAKGEAEKEQAQRDFSLREAEMIATIYKEIQTMVERTAKYRGMTYVLQVSNEPLTSADPRSSYRALQRTVLYADARNDLTKDVISYLNHEYRAAGGPAPRSTTSVNAPAAKPNGQ